MLSRFFTNTYSLFFSIYPLINHITIINIITIPSKYLLLYLLLYKNYKIKKNTKIF